MVKHLDAYHLQLLFQEPHSCCGAEKCTVLGAGFQRRLQGRHSRVYCPGLQQTWKHCTQF